MSAPSINTVPIEPFCEGDRVDVSSHPAYQDCKTTTGCVVECEWEVDDEDGTGMWMVHLLLDNGRRVGLRPSYCELIPTPGAQE